MTHAQAMQRRLPILADSQCRGQLVQRLYKPSWCLVCTECGAQVTFDRAKRVAETVFSREGRPMVVGKEAGQPKQT